MASGARIITSPCRAFGHQNGRRANRICITCQRLYTQIYNSMWYNGKRMILGLKSMDSRQIPRRILQAQNNASRRRRYQRLREQGLTSHEAHARMRGQSVERVRDENIIRLRAYRAKWGGGPNIGSQAWIRREIARTPWAWA